MTKQLVRFAAAVMITLLALIVLWQFHVAIIYVLISLILAATLRPLTNRLIGQGIFVRVAWILLYLVALGGLGCLLFLTSQTAIYEIQQVAHSMSVQDAWRLPTWLAGSSFPQPLVARLPPPSQLFEAIISGQGQLVLPALLGFTQGLGGDVGSVLVILFLSIYWSLNQIHFERLWLSLLPTGRRKPSARYLAGYRIRNWRLHTWPSNPKSPFRAALRPWLLAARFPIPGASGTGRRSGMPDTRGWDSLGSHSSAFSRASHQCTPRPNDGSLCAGRLDFLRNMG